MNSNNINNLSDTSKRENNFTKRKRRRLITVKISRKRMERAQNLSNFSDSSSKDKNDNNEYNDDMTTISNFTSNDINNEVIINLRINQKDINKNIYFLNNPYYNNNDGILQPNNELKELNKINILMFVNDEKYKFKKY